MRTRFGARNKEMGIAFSKFKTLPKRVFAGRHEPQMNTRFGPHSGPLSYSS